MQLFHLLQGRSLPGEIIWNVNDDDHDDHDREDNEDDHDDYYREDNSMKATTIIELRLSKFRLLETEKLAPTGKIFHVWQR